MRPFLIFVLLFASLRYSAPESVTGPQLSGHVPMQFAITFDKNDKQQVTAVTYCLAGYPDADVPGKRERLGMQ